MGGNALSGVDPLGLATFAVSRDLAAFGSSARSLNNPITHSFTVSTNPDGSIAHTYSWGNDTNLTGWTMDHPLDIKTAREALDNGLVGKITPNWMDPYFRDAFDKLNKPENNHSNWILYNNCKAETLKLQKEAWKILTGR